MQRFLLGKLKFAASSIPRIHGYQPRCCYTSGTTAANITYSGGQANEGQGGFYGSGGARITETVVESREGMLALAADVQNITTIMSDIETLEEHLTSEPNPTTGRSMELKNNIKKLLTGPEITGTLDRLVREGEPVWGLSSEERELIIAARQKMKDC